MPADVLHIMRCINLRLTYTYIRVVRRCSTDRGFRLSNWLDGDIRTFGLCTNENVPLPSADKTWSIQLLSVRSIGLGLGLAGRTGPDDGYLIFTYWHISVL